MTRSLCLSLIVALMLAAAAHAAPEVPPDKQTTLGLYATPREAYDKWKAAPDKVKILDVRTSEEYLFVGHAPMAWNVPLSLQVYEWTVSPTGKPRLPMKPNADFLAEVKKIASPTDTIFVMCRSGNRGAIAVNRLAEAGFTHVYNIVEGMEGDPIDKPGTPDHGKRLKNGWKNAGLPWTYDLDPEKMRLPATR